MDTSLGLGDIDAERALRLIARERSADGRVAFEACLDEVTDEKAQLAIGRAYDFARGIDYRQEELSTGPYLAHPLRVASMAMRHATPVDIFTVIVALLHNVLEVSAVTRQDIEERFGTRVRESLEGLCVDRSREWEAAYKDEYYSRLERGHRGARIVKVLDKLDNLFLLCLHPDGEIRGRYLDEVERCIIPMAGRELPPVRGYMKDLVADCRRIGYWANPAAGGGG